MSAFVAHTLSHERAVELDLPSLETPLAPHILSVFTSHDGFQLQPLLALPPGVLTENASTLHATSYTPPGASALVAKRTAGVQNEQNEHTNASAAEVEREYEAMLDMHLHDIFTRARGACDSFDCDWGILSRLISFVAFHFVFLIV